MQLPLLFFWKNPDASFVHPRHSFLRPALLCIAFLATTAAHAQQPFITTWKTNNAGSSNSTSITIPTTGGGYNYEVDWNNDGTYDQSGITGNVTHDFGVAGTYTIQLRGTFPRIYFNNSGDRQKLLNISQWGDIAWTSMNAAFNGCSNLNITATDLPNLNGVTDMLQMFRGCSVLNGPANIGSWNTANVTDMGSMFFGAVAFNQPIGTWNTASVTNMEAMLQSASAFNQPIENWNVGSVTNMKKLFSSAFAFNKPIGTWNTASVTNMNAMFESASVFNQPIGNWNTTSVTNMNAMFLLASNFNQSIANWNTTNVTDMSLMFFQAFTFNQSLGTWTLNASVGLFSMLNNNGMDCDHYSATLIGWSDNPATPNGRSLSANGRLYGTNAVAARTNLGNKKTGSFSGDMASGTDCSAVVLPVTLVNLSGKQQGNDILLEWQTAAEQNNQGFHIERSEDGLRWTDIGFVASKGLSTETQHYSFLDVFPPHRGIRGGLYYRLRQTDFNGKEELSKVVIIDLQTIGTVRVFPNPVSTGELTLFLSKNTEENTVANLFNSAGQLLRSMQISTGNNSLDVSTLPTGVYTLQVGQTFEKIVVQN